MTVIVRELRPDVPADTGGYARVRHLALPYILFTPDSVRHALVHGHPDARTRLLVAEEDGEVIGAAGASLAHDSPEPGMGHLTVYVRPDRTRRGAGRLLARAGEEHLAAVGAVKVFTWVLDEPAHRVFAERHGYTRGRPAHFLRLDLAHGTLPPLAEPPPGAELRTAADFAGDPRPLFELDAETVSDEPGEIDVEFTDYGAWLEQNWRHPLLSRELSTAVVVDGRPVAFTLVCTDGTGRYSTSMTGTARAHRGRGLAKLAKTHSLYRAREAGLTEAFTGNDAGNDPMIAINKWLGYEICATEVRYARELG